VSTEDIYRVPAAPRLLGALRESASDFYYNSWRLVPANIVWGALLVLLMFVASIRPLAALLLFPLLALPTAGVFRMAALIVRGDSVALSDAFEAWRLYLRPALAAGVVFTVLALIFAVNLAVGVASDSFFGAMVAAFAAWGVLVLWTGALAFWPLLVDPRRAELRMRERLRLVAVLVLAFPLRLSALALTLAALVVLSTFVFAALITVSVAFCALVASRYVLPAADRFEGRATELVLE
jgi:hypothetical protein